MELVENMLPETDDTHLLQMQPASANHQHVFSSVLPNMDNEYTCMQEKNSLLERENQALRTKVELLMIDGKQLKEEQYKVHSVLKSRDLLGVQLVQSRNELQLLTRKVSIQTKDLQWERNQNELLRREVESAKRALQKAKQQAVSQRAEKQKLKDQLEQAVKERDSLSEKLLRCRSECSELSEKITVQQSSLNKKENHFKEQMKKIHYLTVENQKLERERRFFENEAKDVRCKLQKCKEELRVQLNECSGCCLFEPPIVERAAPKLKPPLIRKGAQEVPVQKVESLQKELRSQNQELQRTQRLCEELKQSLTQVSVQLQQCKASVRDRREKLKAVTAERDVYWQKVEKLQKELQDNRKDKLSEKLKTWMAKKRSKNKSFSSLNKPHHPTLPSKARVKPDYMTNGSKNQSHDNKSL